MFNNLVKAALLAFATILLFGAATQAQVQQKNLNTDTTALTDALPRIVKLKPVSIGERLGFDWAGYAQPGLTTKQVNWINRGKNNLRAEVSATADVNGMLPLLVAAIQQQQVQIERLQKQVEQLQSTQATR